MTQFFVDMWNSMALYEAIGLVFVVAFLVYLHIKKITTRCPKCGSKFKKVDEENNLIERITNAMTHRSWIDPELPDTSFYRCRGCNFETDNLNTMEFNSKIGRIKPANSEPSEFK